MAKVILLVDALSWYDGDGARHEADGKGSEIELEGDALDHHLKAGSVAKAGSKAAKTAAAGDEPASEEPGE